MALRNLCEYVIDLVLLRSGSRNITIRYGATEEFEVESKAEYSALLGLEGPNPFLSHAYFPFLLHLPPFTLFFRPPSPFLSFPFVPISIPLSYPLLPILLLLAVHFLRFSAEPRSQTFFLSDLRILQLVCVLCDVLLGIQGISDYPYIWIVMLLLDPPMH